MSGGFTKLVPEIIQSSIWNEPADIRIVWITLLAVKDAEGYVRGDARTIARLANVDTETAQKALDLFQQTDPDSHTPDNDGRRIERMSGGWIVLNHNLYRVRDHKAEHAEYVKNWRKKKASVIKCDSQVNHPSASASASESSSERGCKGETRATPLPKPQTAYSADFLQFWEAYPNRKGKKAAWRAWRQATDRPPIDDLVAEIKLQRQSQEWMKDGGAYIPHPATWLNRGGWEDQVKPIRGRD